MLSKEQLEAAENCKEHACLNCIMFEAPAGNEDSCVEIMLQAYKELLAENEQLKAELAKTRCHNGYINQMSPMEPSKTESSNKLYAQYNCTECSGTGRIFKQMPCSDCGGKGTVNVQIGCTFDE